jgi:hypothetical protein
MKTRNSDRSGSSVPRSLQMHEFIMREDPKLNDDFLGRSDMGTQIRQIGEEICAYRGSSTFSDDRDY